MKKQLKKLDLGCGACCREGFIGIDNGSYNSSGKKIIPDIDHDLNRGIPFPDNSCSEILASHSLEHFDCPHYILKEIYRVCIDGAKVNIRVPLLDVITPTHKTCFYSEWFERNLDKSEFRIVSKTVREKHSKKNGQPYIYFELEVWLEVLKSEGKEV